MANLRAYVDVFELPHNTLLSTVPMLYFRYTGLNNSVTSRQYLMLTRLGGLSNLLCNIDISCHSFFYLCLSIIFSISDSLQPFTNPISRILRVSISIFSSLSGKLIIKCVSRHEVLNIMIGVACNLSHSIRRFSTYIYYYFPIENLTHRV